MRRLLALVLIWAATVVALPMTAARAAQDIWVGDSYRPGMYVTTTGSYDSPVFTVVSRSDPMVSYATTAPSRLGSGWTMAALFLVHGIAAPGLYDVLVCEDAGCPDPEDAATLHVIAGAPVVTELSRTSVAPGRSVEASIFGYGLAHQAAVSFGSADITFSGDSEPIAEFVSDVRQTILTGTLTVAATAHGSYPLTVTNTDGQTFTLPDALTVEAGAADPDITVTPSTVVPGATSRVVWHSSAITPEATLTIGDSTVPWIPDVRGGASSTLVLTGQSEPQDATVSRSGTTTSCTGCVHIQRPPTAPKILRQTSSNGDLTLTWEPSPSAAAYLLYADALSPRTLTEVATTATTATLHGLQPGSTHEISVVAVSSAGTSSAPPWTSIPIAPADATFAFPPTLTQAPTYARGSDVVVRGSWVPGSAGLLELREEGAASPYVHYREVIGGDDGSFSFTLSNAVNTDFSLDDGGGTVTGATQVVGTTLDVPAVSAPGRVTPLSGLAKPGSLVTVLDHGTPVASTTTRSNGTWSSSVTPAAADLLLVARTTEADSPSAAVRIAPLTITGPASARRWSTVTVTGTAPPGTVVRPMVMRPSAFSTTADLLTRQGFALRTPIVTPANGHWSFSYRATVTSRYFVLASGVASRVVTTAVS